MRQQFTTSDMDDILHHARRVNVEAHGFGATIHLKNQAETTFAVLAARPAKPKAAAAFVDLLFAYARFCGDGDEVRLSANEFPSWFPREPGAQASVRSAEALHDWTNKLAYMTAERLRLPKGIHAHVRKAFSQVAADFGLSILDIRTAAANLRVVAA